MKEKRKKKLAESRFLEYARRRASCVLVGFTIVELLVIVGIIILLASIVLGVLVYKAQNKATVTAYKVEMQSVRRAVELCVGTGEGEAINPGQQGGVLCLVGGVNGFKYPELPQKCGFPTGTQYQFLDIGNISSENFDWKFSTHNGSEWVDCKGCRLECTLDKCEEIGSCF